NLISDSDIIVSQSTPFFIKLGTVPHPTSRHCIHRRRLIYSNNNSFIMPSTTTSLPDHDWNCPRCNPSGTRPDSGIFGSFLSISLDNNSQDSSPVVRDPTSPQDKAAINRSGRQKTST